MQIRPIVVILPVIEVYLPAFNCTEHLLLGNSSNLDSKYGIIDYIFGVRFVPHTLDYF